MFLTIGEVEGYYFQVDEVVPADDDFVGDPGRDEGLQFVLIDFDVGVSFAGYLSVVGGIEGAACRFDGETLSSGDVFGHDRSGGSCVFNRTIYWPLCL